MLITVHAFRRCVAIRLGRRLGISVTEFRGCRPAAAWEV